MTLIHWTLSFVLGMAASYAQAGPENLQEIFDQTHQYLVENTADDVSLMYSTCYKNPAGGDLAPAQKQFYCAMPLKLRACLTPTLLVFSDEPVDVRTQAFQLCAQLTGFEDLAVLVPGFEEALAHVFLSDALILERGDDFRFENTPELRRESFTELLLASAGSGIARSEKFLCRLLFADSPDCGQ